MSSTALTPDTECRRYVASYYHDGLWWRLDVYAYDWNDADARCKKLGARLDGEFVCAIPGSVKARPLVDWMCRLRNLVSHTDKKLQSRTKIL
jgi:hypothetical protein